MASRRPGSPSAPPNAKRQRHSLTPISNPDTEIDALLLQERGEDRAQLRSQIRSPAATILTTTATTSPATPTTLVSSSHGAMHETEFDENIHEAELPDEEYYEEEGEGEGEGEEAGDEDMGSFSESGRKFLSKAWKEFVPIVVGGVISQAKCKYCEREISAKCKSGTSSMRKHLRRCKLRNSALRVVNNLRTTVMSPDGVALGNWSFDQEVSRLELARMIVLHELPFMIVEYDGFRKFVSSLNPAFKMMSRKTVKGVCMKLFQEQKVALQEILKNSNSRVSLTMDMWTSNQTLGYVCITCHFIDMDWKLQKRIVKFSMMETPHTGQTMFNMILKSIQDWKIENKLFAITLDNASNNGSMVKLLKNNLLQKNMLLGAGKMFHHRCAAHVLNLICQAGFKFLDSIICKIRESVKYIRSSPAQEDEPILEDEDDDVDDVDDDEDETDDDEDETYDDDVSQIR